MALNKRAQFFIIAIVLIYLAIISIFFYVRTSEETSIDFFAEDNSLDMQNILNAIETRNNWMQDNNYAYWILDASFQRRKQITITCADELQSNPSLIKYKTELTDNVRNCEKELRMVHDSGAEVQANVNSTTLPCTIYFNLTCGTTPSTHIFWLYWDNEYASVPPAAQYTRLVGDFEDILVVGGKTLVSGSDEIGPATSLCDHFEQIYPNHGLWLNCTSTFVVGDMDSENYYNQSGNRSKIALEVKNPNLYFNGTVG